MEIITIIILVLVSLFTSFYTQTVGGRELLAIPVLISLGLPPHIAIGTSRTSALLNPVIGMRNFHKHKLVNWNIAIKLALFGGIGALIGLAFFFSINEIILKIIITVITLSGLILIFAKKDLGIIVKKVSKKRKNTGYFFAFLVGVYSGFYGAMFGTFMSYVLIIFFGMTFLQSAGTRKLFAFTRNILTVPILIIAGKVAFLYAGIMLASNVAGSYMGSIYVNRISENAVRIAFAIITIVAVIAMFI